MQRKQDAVRPLKARRCDPTQQDQLALSPDGRAPDIDGQWVEAFET